MRSGKIVAVGNPADMITRLNAGSLEDVFYKICVDSELQNQNLRSEHSDTVRYRKL